MQESVEKANKKQWEDEWINRRLTLWLGGGGEIGGECNFMDIFQKNNIEISKIGKIGKL